MKNEHLHMAMRFLVLAADIAGRERYLMEELPTVVDDAPLPLPTDPDAAYAAPFDDARLVAMTFLTGENPSDTKLNANNALKTSSVKRVQYLIRPDALYEANTAK